MKTQTVKCKLNIALEASPIALLFQEASKFDSSIYVESVGRKVNAKSIMGMMSLGLADGDDVEISVDGNDEDAALSAISKFLTESR